MREYRLPVEISSGLIWGLLGLFVCLYVFSRTSRISGCPGRLVPNYVSASILSTLVRVLVLLIPIGVAILITNSLWHDWFRVVLFSPERFGCPVRKQPHWSVLVALPLVFFVLLQYRIMVFYLDLRYRIQKGDWSREWRNRLATCEFEGRVFPALEEQLVDRIKFVTSSNPKIISPLCYGGGICRPRLVVPEKLLERLQGDLLVPVLLEQVAHIRRGDAFFEVFFCTFGKILKFLREWHSRWCDQLCLTDVMDRFQPEVVIISLAIQRERLEVNGVNAADITISGNYRELRSHALELITSTSALGLTSKVASERNLAWRMLWLAQIYRGALAGLAADSKARIAIRSMRRQTQKIGLIAIFFLLTLVLVAGFRKTSEALAYHVKYLKQINVKKNVRGNGETTESTCRQP